MNDSTEERALPPTPKKLTEARKKGQIFHGSDMVAAATTSALLLVIWFSAGGLVDRLRIALNQADKVSTLPFDQAANMIVGALVDGTLSLLIKLMMALVAVSILTNLMISGGFLFAIEPMKPNADNLNPIEGLKRMFSVRALIELVKSLLKTLLLTTCCIGIGVMSVNAILRAPTCGLGCLGPLFSATIRPLVAVGVLVLLGAGLADLPVQRWLFRRQMRMTRTELKRERKDQEGIPEIRNAQRRERRELLEGAALLGVAATTLFIEGDDVVVGLRYVRGETPVPRLVCKGRGVRAQHLLALGADIAKVVDAELAADLDRRIEVGRFISEEFFNPIARALHIAAAQSI
ncbi:MAG: EscU/YscU/HrcU family type III secretion system export apparatus switch protein [Bradyrhizobium sp.]